MNNNMVQDQEVEKKTYSVVEIAKILGISERSAYYFCSHTTDFRGCIWAGLFASPKSLSTNGFPAAPDPPVLWRQLWQQLKKEVPSMR